MVVLIKENLKIIRIVPARNIWSQIQQKFTWLILIRGSGQHQYAQDTRDLNKLHCLVVAGEHNRGVRHQAWASGPRHWAAQPGLPRTQPHPASHVQPSGGYINIYIAYCINM